MKAQHFHIKLHCEKPVLKQFEWGAQNGPHFFENLV